METVHAGLADQAPGGPPGHDRGRRRAEDPVHHRHPRRDRRDRGGADRVAGSAGRAPRELRPHPGGDPPELRAAPALLRRRSRPTSPTRLRRALDRQGPLVGRLRALGETAGRRRRTSPWSSRLGLPGHDRGHEAPDRRDQAADAGRRRPGPAEPLRLVAGAGRGRGDRPRRAVGQRRPHLARAPVPEPAPGAQGARAAGLRADRAPLRLPAVHGRGVDGAGRARRDQAEVLELHPAARLRPHLRGDARSRASPRRRSPRAARASSPDRGRADRAVRRDPARGDRGDAGRRRRAARTSWPGDTATFVVNRNINFTNICVVGCAFCGFGQGKRSPDAYEVDRGGLRRAGSRKRSSSARPSSACRAASIPDLTLEDVRPLAAAGQGGRRRSIHLHAYSPMEIDHMCERSGKPPARGLRVPDRVRARLDPGHRRRGARRRRAPADLAEQAAGRPLGRDHRGLPPRRPALDLDRDVRPHRGAARAGPPHARWSGRSRSAPAASPSSCRSASSPSTRCSAAPTGSRRSRSQENLKHTAAFRLALGKIDHEPPGELGEDGPRGRDRGAALGRQRPRRHADGGEHLPHGRLPARGPARARGADRRGPARPGGRRPSGRRSTRSSRPTDGYWKPDEHSSTRPQQLPAPVPDGDRAARRPWWRLLGSGHRGRSQPRPARQVLRVGDGAEAAADGGGRSTGRSAAIEGVGLDPPPSSRPSTGAPPSSPPRRPRPKSACKTAIEGVAPTRRRRCRCRSRFCRSLRCRRGPRRRPSPAPPLEVPAVETAEPSKCRRRRRKSPPSEPPARNLRLKNVPP